MEKGILREKYRGAVRRVFLAVFFFAAMFLLSACGNAGSGVPEDSSDMAEAEEPGLAVLLVTDSKIAEDSIEDRTRNGIENFLKKHPSCTLEEIVETDARKAVPRASGYDAAVFVGASFSGIGEAAGEQRDSRFIVIDTTVADAEGEVLSLPNVCTVTFRAEEEGFLAGVGAALSPEADRVTADLDREDPDGALLLGFADGLDYAAGTYGTENTGLEIGDVKSDGDGITIRDAQGLCGDVPRTGSDRRCQGGLHRLCLGGREASSHSGRAAEAQTDKRYDHFGRTVRKNNVTEKFGT